MADKIKVKRGLKANLPVLDTGEFALCTDTKELFIGTSTGNVLVGANISDSDIPSSRIQWITQAEYSELQFNNQLDPNVEYHIVDRPTAYSLQLVGAELRLIINGTTVATCNVSTLLNA